MAIVPVTGAVVTQKRQLATIAALWLAIDKHGTADRGPAEDKLRQPIAEQRQRAAVFEERNRMARDTIRSRKVSLV